MTAHENDKISLKSVGTEMFITNLKLYHAKNYEG